MDAPRSLRQSRSLNTYWFPLILTLNPLLNRYANFTTTNAWTPPGGVYGTDLPQRPPVGIFGPVSKVAEAKCDAAGDAALAHARRIPSACGAPIV